MYTYGPWILRTPVESLARLTARCENNVDGLAVKLALLVGAQLLWLKQQRTRVHV